MHLPISSSKLLLLLNRKVQKAISSLPAGVLLLLGNHRLFNCGLKAARDCLGEGTVLIYDRTVLIEFVAHGLIDTGARIAEQLASKLEIQLPSEQDHPVSNVFRTQYLLLRVLLV